MPFPSALGEAFRPRKDSVCLHSVKNEAEDCGQCDGHQSGLVGDAEDCGGMYLLTMVSISMDCYSHQTAAATSDNETENPIFIPVLQVQVSPCTY